jgi:hypothetical protein
MHLFSVKDRERWREAFSGALVTSLERDELLRALGSAIEGLRREAEEVREQAAKVKPQPDMLTTTWDG